jgi:hexosaminidase
VPIDIIHTGGDEVPEGVWTKSPACDKLMAELGNITEPKNLQQYCVRRINTILSERNLKTAGWEEIALKKNTDGNYIVNPEFAGGQVIPYVWNNLEGSQDLIYRLTNSGYPVVFCGVTNFYLDMAYNKDPQEPGLYWGGFTSERSPWQIAPENVFITINKNEMGEPINAARDYVGMTKLNPKFSDNIIGLQSQLWAETIHGSDMLEHLLLPKLISFAERCWAPVPEWQNIQDENNRVLKTDSDWNIFVNSMVRKELPKLTFYNGGYNFRVPPPGAILKNGILEANTQYPGTEIYFTTDGTEPDENALKYTGPVKVKGEVKLIVFAPGGKKSREIEIINK